MFLVASGSAIPSCFGVMTTPGKGSVPSGIIDGLKWAADNEGFNREFNPARFFPWLETLLPYRHNCIFVSVPDCVGNAHKTLELWDLWRKEFVVWPTAFVAQDGQEKLCIPDDCACVFIGGTTRWKDGNGAIDVIKRAQNMGKHIHIGRVNYKRRYDLFSQIAGSEYFTCDGTRMRFEGIERTLKDWGDYQNGATMVLW